jgi:hypothetical protein
MLSPRIQLLALLPLIALLAGCLGPRRSDYVSSRPISLANRSEQADTFWEAIQETLRRHRFRLDRVDYRAGVITTMPVTSQNILEFWRHDVDTREDLWESTLNPIRRWVECSVTRGADDAWQEVSLVVHKERFSSPDRQFNSTGAALQYFSDSLPSTTGIVKITPEYDQWLDMGRDPAMEDRLLTAIFKRAGMWGAEDPSAGTPQ